MKLKLNVLALVCLLLAGVSPLVAQTAVSGGSSVDEKVGEGAFSVFPFEDFISISCHLSAMACLPFFRLPEQEISKPAIRKQ